MSLQRVRPTPGPVSGRARIDALDALRGFALAGVCVANLPLFASRADVVDALQLPRDPSAVDAAATLLIKGLVEGRFMTLFSIMFGLGIGLMASRITAAGGRAWTVLLRRLVFLTGVGALHTTFIWSGDVLFLYGAVGLLCLPLILRSTRLAWLLFWVAGAATVAGCVVAGVLAAGANLVPPDAADAAAWLADLDRAHRTGDQAGVMALGSSQPQSSGGGQIGIVFLLLVVSRTAWLFAAGVLAHRYGLVQRLHLGDPFGRRALALGLLVGVPSAVLEVTGQALAGSGQGQWTLGVYGLAFFIGGAFMSVAYAVLFLTWWRRASASPVAVGLRALGRVAFSGYLTQSLLAVTAFTLLGAVGASLWGRLSGFGMIAWALGTVALQCVLGVWWLRRFSIGPLEGLWRAVTYWRRPRWVLTQR